MHRNLLILVGLVVFLAVWAAACPQPEKADEAGNWMRLRESSRGCYHSEERLRFWTRQADRFVSEDTPVVLSASQVSHLRQLIRNSSRGRSHFAEEMQLTPQALLEHQPEILQSVSLTELPPSLAGYLDYSKFLESAKTLAFESSSYRTQTEFKLEIDGEPRLSVEFKGGWEMGFPWLVSSGDEQWETCSLAMIDGLSSLSDSHRRTHEIFRSPVQWRTFWDKEPIVGYNLWRDFKVASQELQAREALQTAPSYDLLSRTLQLESVKSWPVTDNGGGAYYNFSAITPQNLDLFTWSNPAGHLPCEPFEIYRQARSEVGRHPWLGRWRQGAPGRHLKLSMEANRPLEKDFSSLQPWERSGLPGHPEFQIDLLENGNHFARVYLSHATDLGLMTYRINDFSYWPSRPAVVLVNPIGEETKIRAVKGSPKKEY